MRTLEGKSYRLEDVYGHHSMRTIYDRTAARLGLSNNFRLTSGARTLPNTTDLKIVETELFQVREPIVYVAMPLSGEGSSSSSSTPTETALAAAAATMTTAAPATTATLVVHLFTSVDDDGDDADGDNDDDVELPPEAAQAAVLPEGAQVGGDGSASQRPEAGAKPAGTGDACAAEPQNYALVPLVVPVDSTTRGEAGTTLAEGLVLQRSDRSRTGYAGVSQLNGKFIARVHVGPRQDRTIGGNFTTAEEAAKFRALYLQQAPNAEL